MLCFVTLVTTDLEILQFTHSQGFNFISSPKKELVTYTNATSRCKLDLSPSDVPIVHCHRHLCVGF